MRGSVITVLAVSLASLVSPAAAAGGLLPAQNPSDPTPYAPNAIRSQFHLQLRPSLDAFDVAIRLEVLEIELKGPQGIPAQAVRDGGAPVHALFEDAARARIQEELRRAFPKSAPALHRLDVSYGASDADADPYRPGVHVDATALLPLTPSLLGASTEGRASGADWARAFFYSGGQARLERSVLVPPGFDAQLRIEVPEALRLASPGPQVGTAAEFARNNMRGQGALPMYVRFEVGLRPDEVPENVLAGPLVRATFRADDETPVWLQAVPFTKGRYAADLDLEIELHSLSMRLFEEQLLPPSLRLERLSADLIRVASRDGLVGAAELESYFHLLIQESLRDDFGDEVKVTMDSGAFRQSLARPVGGAHVEPLLVRAQARIPIRSDQMLASSSIARSLGMVTGTTGGFDLSNAGDWRLELVLLYPEGADIEASDSLRRLQMIREGDREGFRVYLAQGESTDIQVWGRPGFDAAVFAIGLVELVVLLVGGFYVWRQVRSRIRSRRFPWSPRPV